MSSEVQDQGPGDVGNVDSKASEPTTTDEKSAESTKTDSEPSGNDAKETKQEEKPNVEAEEKKEDNEKVKTEEQKELAKEESKQAIPEIKVDSPKITKDTSINLQSVETKQMDIKLEIADENVNQVAENCAEQATISPTEQKIDFSAVPESTPACSITTTDSVDPTPSIQINTAVSISAAESKEVHTNPPALEIKTECEPHVLKTDEKTSQQKSSPANTEKTDHVSDKNESVVKSVPIIDLKVKTDTPLTVVVDDNKSTSKKDVKPTPTSKDKDGSAMTTSAEMHVAVSHINDDPDEEECISGLPVVLTPEEDGKESSCVTIQVDRSSKDVDVATNENKENKRPKQKPPSLKNLPHDNGVKLVCPPRPPPPTRSPRITMKNCNANEEEAVYANKDEIMRREVKVQRAMSLQRSKHDDTHIYDRTAQNKSTAYKSATLGSRSGPALPPRKKNPVTGFFSKVKRRFTTRDDASSAHSGSVGAWARKRFQKHPNASSETATPVHGHTADHSLTSSTDNVDYANMPMSNQRATSHSPSPASLNVSNGRRSASPPPRPQSPTTVRRSNTTAQSPSSRPFSTGSRMSSVDDAPTRPPRPPSISRSQTMPSGQRLTSFHRQSNYQDHYDMDSPDDDLPHPPCVSFPTTNVITVIYPVPPCPSFPTMCGSPAVAPPVPPCISFPTNSGPPVVWPLELETASATNKCSASLQMRRSPPRPPSMGLTISTTPTKRHSTPSRPISPPNRPLSPPPKPFLPEIIYAKPTRPPRPIMSPPPPASPSMDLIKEEEDDIIAIDAKEAESEPSRCEKVPEEEEVKLRTSVKVNADAPSRASVAVSRPHRPPPLTKEKVTLRKTQSLSAAQSGQYASLIASGKAGNTTAQVSSSSPVPAETNELTLLYPILSRLNKKRSSKDEYSWRVSAVTSTEAGSGSRSASYFPGTIRPLGSSNEESNAVWDSSDYSLGLRQLMEDSIRNFLAAWRQQVIHEMSRMPRPKSGPPGGVGSGWTGHPGGFVLTPVDGWRGLVMLSCAGSKDKFVAIEDSPDSDCVAPRANVVDLLDAYLNCEARMSSTSIFPAVHIGTLQQNFNEKLSEVSRILLLLNTLLTFQKVSYTLDPGTTLDTKASNILVVSSPWNQLIVFRRRQTNTSATGMPNSESSSALSTVATDYETSQKVLLGELKALHAPGFMSDMLECTLTTHQAIHRSIQRVFSLVQKESGVPASVYLMPHLFQALQPPDLVAYMVTRIYAFKTGVD